jgi:hypothetical protein
VRHCGIADLCRCVTMMESGDSREGLNPASDGRLGRNRPTRWRILCNAEVRPIFMVVAHILGQ